MYRMSDDQWRAFVMAGTRTGKLATVRRNGLPHVVPVWFVIDSGDGRDEIVFTTGADTVKGRALRRDPRCSMCVDEETPPYAYVFFEAEARLSDDLEAMLRVATRLGARYMGRERGEAFGRRNAVPGQLLVRATVTRVIAIGDIAG